MGSLFETRVAWVPANDMRGSPLCYENLRYATTGKMGWWSLNIVNFKKGRMLWLLKKK
jgi:hypothetical protein